MKREQRRYLFGAVGLWTAFVLWTVVVCTVDVQPIGPQGTEVGLATINRWFHDLTGVHLTLYTLTDRLSLIPFGLMVGFALLGLTQWIGRRSLKQVDGSLFVLGGFYLAVMAVYGFFECVVVNYRPILIEGEMEASYPSSTTMLVLCVMPTAVLQLRERMGNRTPRKWICVGLTAFTAFMVFGRLLSGVHWLTDIIGGGLISAALVMAYLGVLPKNPK